MNANMRQPMNMANTTNAGTVPPLRMPWYGIGFGNASRRFWSKAFVMKGRASRGEYWWAMLMCLIVEGIVALAAFAGDVAIWHDSSGDGPLSTWVILALELVLLVPSLTISVRRLHDENLSGWWVLLPAAIMLACGAVGAAALAGAPGQEGLMVTGLLAAALLAVGYLASEIVLFVLPTNPKGMRFDGDARSGK